MKKLSNTEIVYQKLKKSILICEYEPGELISEKDLVECYRTSRTPVREAINMLSGEGYVDILPKKGIQISKLSVKQLKEVYELRRILEPIAISAAINFVTEDDIKTLKNFDVQLEGVVEDEDVFTLFSAGMDYHLYVAKLSRNDTLFNLLKTLREQSNRGLIFYLKSYLQTCTQSQRKEVLSFIGHEHKVITEALQKKDKEIAMDAITNDLRTMDDVIKYFSM